MKHLSRLILSSLLLCQSVLANNYYIDPIGGSDVNNGSVSAWQTLGKIGSSTFSAGDNIYLANTGTHTGYTLRLGQSGTAGNPITISSYTIGGGTNTGFATIDGQNTLSQIVYSSSKNYQTYKNLNIINGTGSTAVGVAQFSNCTGITWDNCTIGTSSGNTQGLLFEGGTNSVVSTGTITGQPSDGLRAMVGSTPNYGLIVQGMSITHNGGNGILMSNATDFSIGTSNVSWNRDYANILVRVTIAGYTIQNFIIATVTANYAGTGTGITGSGISIEVAEGAGLSGTITNGTVENCTTSYNKELGVVVGWNCNNIVIKDGTSNYNGVLGLVPGTPYYGNGIEIYSGLSSVGPSVLVENYECAFNGTNGHGDGQGIRNDGNNGSCTVRYNYLHDNEGAGYSYGGSINPNYPVEVYGNILKNNGLEWDSNNDNWTSIMLANITGTATFSTLRFYNNVIDGGKHGVVCMTNSQGTPGAVFYNNIFINIPQYVFRDSTAGKLAREDYNIWQTIGTGTGYNAWTQGQGTNTTNVDPLFVDANNANYRLNWNSPAINTGTSTYQYAQDYYGNLAPYEIIDKGIYEYQGLAGAGRMTATSGNMDYAMTRSNVLDVIDDSLVLHVPLKHSGMSYAQDVSQYQIQGTITGATWATGTARGLYFDGVNDRIVFISNSQTEIGTGSKSIGCWVYPVNSKGTRDFALYAGANTEGGYVFELGSGAWSARLSGATGTVLLNFSESPLNNQWSKLDLVVDRTNNIAKVFLNGVQTGTDTTFISFGTLASDRALWLGIENDAVSKPFNGYLDNIRIYNRALSNDEVNRIYTATKH